MVLAEVFWAFIGMVSGWMISNLPETIAKAKKNIWKKCFKKF